MIDLAKSNSFKRFDSHPDVIITETFFKENLNTFLRTENYLIDKLKHTKWHESTLHPKFNTVKDFGEHYNISLGDYVSYAWGAQFIIRKEDIYSRKRSFYQELQKSLVSIAPIEGHYMERLWDAVFTGEEPVRSALDKC